ncbi:hypothetical protein [Methanogenium organophilum]|uniref:Uncharacterized protein n=1 Tax=Methanogenium organophilum TaxID=2199 RepID=A0A9X9S3X6_METOG|nr:hypothetical protein [Methanogenium organophilum]WAI01499.1 hypothetical protein OU421_01105 [Methanogenium organophilum]
MGYFVWWISAKAHVPQVKAVANGTYPYTVSGGTHSLPYRHSQSNRLFSDAETTVVHEPDRQCQHLIA